MTENEQDKMLIELSGIYGELRKDALEVTELLIRGVESYKISSYIWLFLAVISLAFTLWSKPSTINDILSLNFLGPLLLFILSVITTIKSRIDYSRLKKKYSKLIEIEKSLKGE